MIIGKLKSVRAAGGFALELEWDDGAHAILDLTAIVGNREILAPLRDKTEFAKVSLSADHWSVEWPCGVDFGAPQLRVWAGDLAKTSEHI